MKYRFILGLLLFAILFSSCAKHEIIYYKYNGVVITRVDYDADTDFYYGFYKPYEIKNVQNYIHDEYHGLNNGMDLYLVFKPDKTVEFINFGLGYLSKKGKNENLFIGEYDNDLLDSVLHKYETSYGLIRLSDVKEVRLNGRQKSILMLKS